MCDKCKDGLIPFVKNGKVIPYAWEHCPTCYQTHAEQEYPYKLTPDQFDYPMSFDYYRSLCQLHGWQDPGSDKPPEPELIAPKPQEIIHRHSDMGKAEFDLLQQTARKAEYLEKTLIEHIKPKPKAQGKYGYRGIR